MRKKLCALLLIVAILSCTLFRAESKAAGIAIGGGVVITVGQAVAYALVSVGIISSSVVIYKHGDDITEWGLERLYDFKDWCSQSTEYVSLRVSVIDTWFQKLSAGVMDKSSAVYDAFMDWASSLHYQVANPVYVEGDLSKYFPQLAILPFKVRYNQLPDWAVPYFSGSKWVIWGDPSSRLRMFFSDKYINLSLTGMSSSSMSYYVKLGKHVSYSGTLNDLSYYDSTSTTESGTYKSSYDFYIGGDIDQLYISGSTLDIDDIESSLNDYLTVGGVNDIWDKTESLADIDIVGKGSLSGSNVVEIDYPKDISDWLTNVVEGVQSWEDSLADTGVVVVDDTQDLVIGDSGVTDVPKEDVVVPVPSGMGDFVIEGLTTLFPFCLPFDLVDFIGVLASDPVAPHFVYTFTYPTLNGMATYDIDIDLSKFDTVAEIVRTMECLLFIIGLIMVTRSHMIRG